jgi:hypothetical protein
LVDVQIRHQFALIERGFSDLLAGLAPTPPGQPAAGDHPNGRSALVFRTIFVYDTCTYDRDYPHGTWQEKTNGHEHRRARDRGDRR